MLRSVHSQTTDLKGQASAQLSWTQESTSRQFIITVVPKKRCSKRCSRAGLPSSTMNECEDSAHPKLWQHLIRLQSRRFFGHSSSHPSRSPSGTSLEQPLFSY